MRVNGGWLTSGASPLWPLEEVQFLANPVSASNLSLRGCCLVWHRTKIPKLTRQACFSIAQSRDAVSTMCLHSLSRLS